MPQGQFGVEDVLIDQKLLLEEIRQLLRIVVMHLVEMSGDEFDESETQD